MKETARIVWNPEQAAAIKQGVSVPLGILLWNPQEETMSILLCDGQDLAQVRAMITGYIRSDNEEFSTRIQSEEDNEK